MLKIGVRTAVLALAGLFLVGLALWASPTVHAGTQTQRFKITGNSNGTGWSWKVLIDYWDKFLDEPQTTVRSGSVADDVVEGGCEALRDAFVTSINVPGVPDVSASPKEAGCEFNITVTWEENLIMFRLFVGQIGDPLPSHCNVTMNGPCTFNPTIELVQPVGGIAELPGVAGTPVEALGSSGPNTGVIAGLVGALLVGTVTLGAGTWYARRRWSG